MSPHFTNRQQAGALLARRVAGLGLAGPVVVLALPRGGVPVGAEVARALNAPLDLILVRKIGASGQPELAIAAVVEGDPPQIVIDQQTLACSGDTRADIESRAPGELAEIERRRKVYLGGRPQVDVRGATVIVVDDGIATGTTMRAALQALRSRRPARVVLAVPVAPPATLARLAHEVDQVVCLSQPPVFDAIGRFYDDFHQLHDDEVIAALADNAARMAPTAAPGGP